jgi:asparagine synthase (glutamine-hydrolysing)
MSGGLDSTTVAATAHRLLSRSRASFDLRAHTSVYDRVVPDQERTYSQLAANAIGIPIHHYPLDGVGLPPPEPESDWYPPEPQFLFDRRLGAADLEPAATSRVLLRGEGVDALLDAPSSVLDKRLREGHYGRLARDFIWLMCTRRRVRRLGIRTIVRRAFGRPIPTPAQPYPAWLAPAFAGRLDLRGRWNTANARVEVRPGFELTGSFWSLHFEALDPGTMQLAAEVRYPFLDLRLARYLLRLPPIPWATEKSLLRVAMRGVLPGRVLRRPKTPVAGNPWAPLLPPADTSWWDEYLIPAPGLEAFVDVAVAKATLARVVRKTQAINEHKDIDMLRSSLRPIGLNLWLRQTACATFNPAVSTLREVASGREG